MLSNQWTFSLKILVVLLVLACVAPLALAADFAMELSVEDVSFADKSFPRYRHDNQVELNTNTIVYVKFDKVVDYRAVPPTQGQQTPPSFDEFKDTGVFTHHDVVIQIYNEYGGVYRTLTGAGVVVIEPSSRNQHDGKNFKITFNTRDNSGPTPSTEKHKSVLVSIKQGAVTAVDPEVPAADSKNALASVSFDLVSRDGLPGAYPDPQRAGEFILAPEPHVYGIWRTDQLVKTAGVTEPFKVRIRLSEQPNTFTTDHIDVTEGKATEIILLEPVHEDVDDFSDYIRAVGREDNAYFPPTGRRNLHYHYLVTIEPKFENKNDIVIKVKAFEDLVKPTRFDPNAPYKYTPPASEGEYVEGADKLTVKVDKVNPGPDLTDGLEVLLNNKNGDNHIVIPKDGYLLVAESIAGSAIDPPPGNKHEAPKATERRDAQLKYNIIEADLPNLQARLINGVVMDVVAPKGLMVTEVMWGEDSSLTDPSNSQWIELKNTSGEQLTLDKGKKDYKLVFYRHGETVPTQADPIVDRIGTMTDGTGAGYWSPAGTGQGGRTGEGEKAADFAATIETTSIISMYRVADATDGTLKASWMQSSPPNVNFDPDKSGVRVGTPGAAHIITAAQQKVLDDAAAAKKKSDDEAAAKAADTSVAMPKVGQIYISEVMFAGGGTLPQWIEISNGSRSEEVNLSGWTITVDNAAADTDVSVGATATFTIPEGTRIDPSGQHATPSTLLVVTERGRNSLTGPQASGQVLNLAEANEVELILAGVVTGKYTLLSDTAFLITLAPPEPEATKAPAGETKTAKATRQAAEKKAALERKAATDMAGNLGADGGAAWALPMNDEGGRSSIIRRHVQVARGPAAPEDGMMSENWSLASETSFAQVTHIRAQSYYGAANDVGTPGFRAGGALPVELSHFRPVRDKDTGAVVIAWSTQSELNNAGFFIKRSQQRDGDFQVINATLVPGAGTTSERQFYTYTDTTAQPTVVYYYQIEDVSLDGNRQTLTRGIRLKGHVGAAGKATTTWADLKTHE